MAAKDLKVDELRAELAKRGLGTAGIRPTLVRRLEAAIREDSEKLDDSKGRKRPRDSNADDGDTEAPRKVKAIDELRTMTVKQLREKASELGMSTSGTKQELLGRLCAGEDDVPSDIDKVEEESKENVDSNGRQKVKAIDELQSMTIKQLQEEAAIRGISASGSKKELIDRLCANNYDVSSDNSPVVEEESKEIVDSNAPQKVRSVDELQRMTVKQLREEAATRGISASGTKKELLERLCVDNDNFSRDNGPVKEETKVEKIVTAVKKGSAVLDKCLPDHIKAQYHVLQVGDEVYDAMLNQTNIGENNNKFFVIQVLESDDGGKFMVYFRWGRVGVKGQDKLNGPYSSLQTAIDMFEKKFSDKTMNQWFNRKFFVSHPKSYTWLEMDYSENNEPLVQKKQEPTALTKPVESKLEVRIAKFISLICNISMMRQEMMEIGYNADKLPLGKLSKSTILKGYDVLKRISDVIGQTDRKTLEQLSGEFYTVIPHDFGFQKTRLFIIDTPQKLKGKLQMVEALAEIEVAMKLIKDDTDAEDPLYSHYRRLNCELMPLEVHSQEYSMIEKYTKNTHAKTHTGYGVDIVQIFKVSREGESERFRKFSEEKNRMLLWHGSRLTNWTGILSQGLRIAPPEAPVTGYMFGKGVYFADMFSKSANYCRSTTSTTDGVLLLCEVALGDMAELLSSNYNADKLPPGKLSTKGVGSTAPDFKEAQILQDGVVVPLGRPKQQGRSKGCLRYNEFIVYNVEQIRMRYLVHVKFNYK